MFNKLIIIYWMNKIQHEIIWHIQMNPNYDVLGFIDYKTRQLVNDSNVSDVWVELYNGKVLLDTIKDKVSNVDNHQRNTETYFENKEI